MEILIEFYTPITMFAINFILNVIFYSKENTINTLMAINIVFVPNQCSIITPHTFINNFITKCICLQYQTLIKIFKFIEKNHS